jgi:hypothetical protein
MVQFDAPLFFSIVFGLFDVLIFLILTDLWFYRSVIDVSPRGLAVTGGPFGLGATRQIEAADVKTLETERGMSSNQNVYYNLVVVRSNGARMTMGKRVRGQRLATAVMRQMEQALERP